MATKERLIEANALMKAIKSFRWVGVPNTLKLMFDYLKIIIRDQPTVDAVEVVRCKDCTYWKRHTKVDDLYGACSLIGCTKHENGFCDCGERRSND